MKDIKPALTTAATVVKQLSESGTIDLMWGTAYTIAAMVTKKKHLGWIGLAYSSRGLILSRLDRIEKAIS